MAHVYLNVVTGELPLELRDDVNDLMKKKPNDSNRETNDPHHQPSEARNCVKVIKNMLSTMFLHSLS